MVPVETFRVWTIQRSAYNTWMWGMIEWQEPKMTQGFEPEQPASQVIINELNGKTREEQV